MSDIKLDINHYLAMNIVYQLGDFYGLSVEQRQKTNDEAIDFVLKLINKRMAEVVSEAAKPDLLPEPPKEQP